MKMSSTHDLCDPNNLRYEECFAIDGKGLCTRIRLESIPSGEIVSDNVWFENGVCIRADVDRVFQSEDEGLVQALFPPGMEPSYVASELRKFADMLDGENGAATVSLEMQPLNVEAAKKLIDYQCCD